MLVTLNDLTPFLVKTRNTFRQIIRNRIFHPYKWTIIYCYTYCLVIQDTLVCTLLSQLKYFIDFPIQFFLQTDHALLGYVVINLSRF